MDNFIIDRNTYRSIKKMSRAELQSFLMRYAENLTKDNPVIDLHKLEQDIKSIKGIEGKCAVEITPSLEHLSVCLNNKIIFRTSCISTLNMVYYK